MYKNVCHKIIVYVLVGCLSFGVPATTYYKSVHAIEFLGGALAFEEALKWLLAIVGVTAAGSVASQVDWSEVRDQCVEVQLHNGASQAQVSEWWSKLAKGTLDKASSCWTSFLDWSDSLVVGSGSSSPSFSNNAMVDYLLSQYNLHNNYNLNLNGNTLSSGYICESNSTGYYYIYLFSSSNLSMLQGSASNQFNIVASDHSSFTVYYCDRFTSSSTLSFQSGNTSNLSSYISNFRSLKLYNISQNFVSDKITDVTGSSSGSGSVSSDWQSAIDVARENLNLLNRDLPDENSSEVSIPMPGLADSDNEVSADAYDNIIDAINDGTITLDDGIAQIQDLLHVLVIDNTTDIVQPVRPDPDTGEDQTKEDVIKENKSNMGFTLAGLEKVFPFCIPFDIYAFMTLLVAEPVAPEFDFPIKSVNNQTEEIHIDLSPFEPVAVVVRYIFDFLFIIGLALMTRSLIGGGSSD